MSVWTDPSTLTDEQIEAELYELGKKLAEVREAGGKMCELEGRQWRLRAEQTFRQRSK
jgi:hypothetical protein